MPVKYLNLQVASAFSSKTVSHDSSAFLGHYLRLDTWEEAELGRNLLCTSPCLVSTRGTLKGNYMCQTCARCSRSKHITLSNAKASKVLWLDEMPARLFKTEEHFSYLRTLISHRKGPNLILLVQSSIQGKQFFYLKIWPACCFMCNFY